MSDSDGATMRDHFLGWQCRLRQMAMRRDGGRPSPGMRPAVLRADGSEIAAGVIVLILPREPAESSEFFRFQLRKTNDPKLVYERGLAYLQATHYQQPRRFDEILTALFPPGSATAETLVSEGACTFRFEQFNQSYSLPCAIEQLVPGSDAWDHTYWHNSLFNPNIPVDSVILAFRPDWTAAAATPPP